MKIFKKLHLPIAVLHKFFKNSPASGFPPPEYQCIYTSKVLIFQYSKPDLLIKPSNNFEKFQKIENILHKSKILGKNCGVLRSP